ncbi:phosphopantetheine-binding protein [Staphylococcus aureus]|uniref:phosphopantetheine-binding protein n=1 Tax=Staphylococcus aureus TaxID=1280 RepID=UPI003D156ECA
MEANLKTQKDIHSAVAVIVEDTNEQKRIIAFVEMNKENQYVLETNSLKEQFNLNLPNHMVPSHIEAIEKLPLNKNGKIDRLKLTEIAKELITKEITNEYTAPRTQLESIITSLMSDVLNINTLSINDNFFDLGGDSIIATRLNNRIEEMLGINIPLSTLFNNPTVKKLCIFINQGEHSQSINDFIKMLSQLETSEINSIISNIQN